MTQIELCGDCINRNVLGRIENDIMLPSLEQLQYIAKRLSKDISYFTCEEKLNPEYSTIEQSSRDFPLLSDIYQKSQYYEIIKVWEVDKKKYTGKEFGEDYYIGMSYFKMEILQEAIKPLRKYVSKYTKSSPDIQLKYISSFLETLNALYKIMKRNSNYSKCETYLKTAKKYVLKYNVDNSYIGFVIYNNLACLYLKEYKYNEIIALLEPFIESHKTLIYPEVLSSMFLSLNIACYNLNDFKSSIKYIEKAIHLNLFNDNIVAESGCYINYINSLRYAMDFTKAFLVLEDCLNKYKTYPDICQRFLMQEIILCLNTENYQRLIETKKHIRINKLNQTNKYDYYFIIGHVEHIYNKNDNVSFDCLIKYEKHYKQNNYAEDLYVLYQDLYEITGDEMYKNKANECKTLLCKRKNIFI